MSLEGLISHLNRHFFYGEFCYSKNTFRPTPGGDEAELADHVLWLGESLIVFQLKERNVEGASSPQTEARWFHRKVLGNASRQIRDTLQYLAENEEITVRNERGDAFCLRRNQIAITRKVICFSAIDALPDDLRKVKFYQSETAGLIHLFPLEEYRNVVRTLLTNAELHEYLAFREEMFIRVGEGLNGLTEKCLVGQFISGELVAPPSEGFAVDVDNLHHRAAEWDMSGIITNFRERITRAEGPPNGYYAILSELAKLKRNELREFKQRFELAMRNSGRDFVLPYRMFSPRVDCGFVFVPIPQGHEGAWLIALSNFTALAKYDFEASKCIGVSFSPVEGGWYDVNWYFLEQPWLFDQEIEQALTENNPFRDVRIRELPRYNRD